MSKLDRNRPMVPDAMALVPAYMAEIKVKGHDPLHALIEDRNLGDVFCRVDRQDMPAAKALGDMLLRMSKTQRGRVATLVSELPQV